MKILVNVTTYKRRRLLKRLLKQLNEFDVDVQVWDDDPKGTKIEGVKYTKFLINHGKKLLWLKFKQIFEQLKKTNYDYYFFIPDDVTLNKNFISKTITTWQSINDENKICISLLIDERIKTTNWTTEPRIQDKVILTQWCDLCFLCEKKFIDLVEIEPVEPERWDINPNLGSGVGKNISWFFYNKGYNLYNMKEKLIQHLAVESKMNKNERKINKLI